MIEKAKVLKITIAINNKGMAQEVKTENIRDDVEGQILIIGMLNKALSDQTEKLKTIKRFNTK